MNEVFNIFVTWAVVPAQQLRVPRCRESACVSPLLHVEPESFHTLVPRVLIPTSNFQGQKSHVWCTHIYTRKTYIVTQDPNT